MGSDAMSTGDLPCLECGQYNCIGHTKARYFTDDNVYHNIQPTEADLHTPSEADLLAELAAYAAPPGRPGPGWFTAGEIAAENGEDVDRQRKRLEAMYHRGKIDRVTVGNKAYYRMVK